MQPRFYNIQVNFILKKTTNHILIQRVYVNALQKPWNNHQNNNKMFYKKQFILFCSLSLSGGPVVSVEFPNALKKIYRFLIEIMSLLVYYREQRGILTEQETCFLVGPEPLRDILRKISYWDGLSLLRFKVDQNFKYSYDFI